MIRAAGPSLGPAMLAALLASVVAFTLVYVSLLRCRPHQAALEAAAERSSEAEPLAGTAVIAPRLSREALDA